MKRANYGSRIACMILVIVLMAMTAAPALAASKSNRAYVVATSSKHERLKLRSSPGGSAIAKLKRGTVVVYRYSQDGWWCVYYRYGSGFLDKTYLWPVSASKTAKYTPVDNVNVRSQPKTNAYILGKLKAGKKVTIVAQSGNWAKINYKGYLGWVPSIYLFRVK